MPQPEKYISVAEYLSTEGRSAQKYELGLDKMVPVDSLGIEIPMRVLYAGLEGLAEPQISIDL